jgi:hypothetical protein
MTQRLASLLAAFAAGRRAYQLLFFLAAFSISASAQNWSPFLDSSRATNWTGAGFTIPSYSAKCSTQPSLSAGSGAASANATAIQNALKSCDSTHNVVSIPAGTWYVAGIQFGTQGHQVLRGAGPKSTNIILTAEMGCGGLHHGVCMMDGNPTYDGNSVVLPSGSNQCQWTGGLSKGSTSITLSGCGSAPPANHMIILDQANDTKDTGGVYICDTNIANCGYEGSSGGNNNGRTVNGVTHSQQQVTYVTGVTNSGNGTYTATISPEVYFTNIRSSQSPGAWWSGTVQNDGIENMTVDGSSLPDGTIGMYDCYQCWVKNIRSLDAARNHVEIYQSGDDVVRDSYFYQSQSHASSSYVIEFEEASGILVENNIFQQVTNPLMFGQGSGSVIGYNFSINQETSSLYSLQTSYYSHNAGNEMNLWEGNDFLGIWTDDAWGSSAQGTVFRNALSGWQGGGYSTGFIPLQIRTWVRGFNVVGNVLGQSGVQKQYQANAISSSGGSGGTNAGASIYEIGWADTSGYGSCGSPSCDPLAVSTLMRWGNYDTVNAGTQWNAAEASPAAVPYLKANYSSSYFSSLSHTLPASLYYNSTPSWWPSGKAWPPVGPDVSAGNVGTCSGTYTGAQATASSQCAGGTLNSAWASHVTSIPAQDCYLNVMHGPPDGSGGALSFDASTCYGSSSSGGSGGTQPASPTGLTGTVVTQ